MKGLAPMRVTGKIGFYGCAGRVVRVGLAIDPGAKGKPPAGVRVACPACGNDHTVAISWRQPVDADADREPDLVLDGDGAVVSP